MKAIKADNLLIVSLYIRTLDRSVLEPIFRGLG